MRLPRSIVASAVPLAVCLAVAGCTGAPAPGTASTTSSPDGAGGTAATVSPADSPTSTPVASPTTSPSAPPSDTTAPSTPSSDTTTPGAKGAGTALAALEELEVKGRAPKTGYDRIQFGPAWADTDHNGCDTRNDVLARDLSGETFRPGTQDCVVLTGVLDDPYTATEIHFLRGQDTSTDVQVDHVVSLSDAWQKGAQQLSSSERTAFANDPLNLLAVDGPANAQKSDADAASWLPANTSFRCEFVARQITVKAEYTLWVTTAEKDAMTRVLSDCPDQALPTHATASQPYTIETRSTQSPTSAPEPTTSAPAPAPTGPARAPGPAASSTPAPAPTTQAPPSEPDGTDPRFSSCAKAIAAGYGPYVAGTDPEYHWYRDGDNDGINCE